MDKCKYGCGNDGTFTLKNGSKCCSSIWTKCPKLREKNSNSLKSAYTEGKRLSGKEVYDSLSESTKQKMSDSNRGKYNTDFTLNSKYKSGNKIVLISERGHRCESCKLDEWLDTPITLEIDHIDGDRRNNTKENLRLVCPNCHSKSSTWRRKKTKNQYQKYSDSEILDAVYKSKSMNDTIDSLGLRWNSYSTIIKVMKKYNVDLSVWMK